MKTRLTWLTPLVLVLLAGTAQAADPVSVPVTGTVSGQPESVVFSGQARVSSRLAPDPDFGKPRLVLTIDLTGVSGTGAQSAAKYVVYGPEIVQREVAAAHKVEISFPFKSSISPDAVLARSGAATFALSFDTATGAITSASGVVATLNLPR